MAHKNGHIAHEDYIAGVRRLVVNMAVLTDEERSRIEHARLMYGAGSGNVRGTCYYEAWENGVGKVDVVEIAAAAQESWVQLAGTTVHELAHVLAGMGSGHGKAWKVAATRLGFRLEPKAAGQRYALAQFHSDFRVATEALAKAIADGRPAFRSSWLTVSGGSPRPCSAGIGTQGGKSRGAGSGSRLRLYECGCQKPVKVRVASDDFAAHCDLCDQPFAKVER